MSLSAFHSLDLSYGISDIRYSQRGGLFRADREYLLEELRTLQKSQRLSSCYIDSVVHPVFVYLTHYLTETKFNTIFTTHVEDLTNSVEKKIQAGFPVLLEALLQRNYSKRYYKSAFNDLLAFQAIVDSVFELAIKEIASPMPPLAAWSRKRNGPFTITAQKFCKMDMNLDIPVGVVCLPPEFRNGGLFAWSTMGHEVAGHNFIQGKPGLLNELTKAVKNGLEKKLSAALKKKPKNIIENLCEYWQKRKRVEEIASDILGVLSTGPYIAIGCIGYFRGMSRDCLLKTSGPFNTEEKNSVLRLHKDGVDIRIEKLSKKVEIKETQGVFGKHKGEDLFYTAHKVHAGPHPVEALRPFAMADAISHTKINKKSKREWINLIEKEVRSKEFVKEKFVKLSKTNTKTLPPETSEIKIPFETAILSAKIVSSIISSTKIKLLGGRSISDVFIWDDHDEGLVNHVREVLTGNAQDLQHDASANHIIAAAVLEASKKDANIEALFQKMKQSLVNIKTRS